MSSTLFSNGTVIEASWLNDVNNFVYNNQIGRSVFEYMTAAQKADVQAGTLLIDVQAALQAAHDANDVVYYPPGLYRVSAPVVLSSKSSVLGANMPSTQIWTYGCNAYELVGTAGAGDSVAIKDITIISRATDGSADPLLYTGIKCGGTSGGVANRVNFFCAERVYIQGCLYAIDWQYTWNSALDKVVTVNCSNGVRLFGQSVNNSITSSLLQVTGASSASIRTTKDGSTAGEGLAVTNTLMSLGTYGITSDGFLSLGITNCIIDLVQSIGLDLTGVTALYLSNSWVYAEDYGIKINTLGSMATIGAAISNCYITANASSGIGVYVGGNNRGVTISGGYIKCGSTGTARCVYPDSGSDSVAVSTVWLENPSSNPSIFVVGTNFKYSNLLGTTTIQWFSGVVAPTGTAIATLKFTGATGVKVSGTGATVSRGSTGTYTVTFDAALPSANYIPMIMGRATTKTSVVYEFTSLSTTAFTFTVKDQTDTVFDPTEVFVIVHQ